MAASPDDKARVPQQPPPPPIAGTVGVVRLFGVPVRLHFTFLLLLIFLITVGVGGRESMMTDVLYIVALFSSVLLHELGHALVSRRYGINTIEIVMFPIGGLARLDRSPKPREEIWIAVAGPVVNLVIALLIAVFLNLGDDAMQVFARLNVPTDENLLHRIGAGNLALALFNLIPAFPMDGGRILRAAIALRAGEERATKLAAATGQILAVVIGLYGLLNAQFFLVFIAFFVYLGAAQEGTASAGRALTRGVPVRAAMITDFHTLKHGDTIREAAELLLSTSQQDFPVVLGEQVMGLLGRAALIRAMASAGPDSYVAAAMNREFRRVPPDMELSEAVAMMMPGDTCLLVMDGDRLLGMLTGENLAEFLLLRRVGMRPAVEA